MGLEILVTALAYVFIGLPLRRMVRRMMRPNQPPPTPPPSCGGPF
jgi:hypothetical protein